MSSMATRYEMSTSVSMPESFRASNSSTEVRADAIRYSMIADASAYLEGKWKYIAPLVTSASARMSSRLTKLYDLRANWCDAARRICSRVVSARLSSCSVTCGPRNLDGGSCGRGNRVFCRLGNHLILSSAARKRRRRAGFVAHTGRGPASWSSTFRFMGQTDCQYSKSWFSLHNSRKVCKVLDVMTLGSALSGRPLTADSEVSGVASPRAPLSPGNSQWYFHVVAIVRVGKPPRTPARAVATSCRPLVSLARSAELDRPNSSIRGPLGSQVRGAGVG